MERPSKMTTQCKWGSVRNGRMNHVVVFENMEAQMEGVRVDCVQFMNGLSVGVCKGHEWSGRTAMN